MTLRDVAREANVSLATVSRALREDPSAATKTREHVQAVADRLGYRPDPAMQVLIERRWRGRRADEGLNLAYLYNSSIVDSTIARKQFKSFREVAESLGYQLLLIDLCEFPNEQKLLRRLDVQGISGVVFSILSESPYDLIGVCNRFAAVSINVSTYQPNCPIIIHDEFRGIEKVWKQLQQQGYGRFGVLFEEHPESFSMDQRLGAVFCRQNLNQPAKKRIPIFFYKKTQGIDKAKLDKWITNYQPDVVLGDSHDELVQLTECGYTVPDDFAFASVNMWDPALVGNIAGYYRDNVILFERGIQLLNMMMRSGMTASSHGQLIEMVEGVWKEGKSLPTLKLQPT